MEKTISLLKKFDFTESESRVYISLLENGASTGYEISKLSSVPRSKVYNVLEALIEKGVVVSAKHTKPIYYNAIPIDEFIKNIKHDFNENLNAIHKELKTFEHKVNLDFMWYIRGYENIFNKCRNLIKQTKEELYLQIWKEDLDLVYEDLKSLDDKNIKSLVILYSEKHDYATDLRNCYMHGFEEEKVKEIGGRWITLVSDSKEVVFGYIRNTKNAEVIWTESIPLVFLAKEYVKHDAYCLRVLDHLQGAAKDVFGENLGSVRNVFEKFYNPV